MSDMMWLWDSAIKRFVLVASLFASVTLLGCRTVPLEDVVEVPLWPYAKDEPNDAVDEAIWRAGRKAGWRMERVGPGELRGDWRKGHHRVVVAITHDDLHLRVRYVASENLKERDGEIHGAYGRLVNQLLHQIRQERVTPVMNSPG